MNLPAPDNAVRTVDPFGFFNGYASCIKPLGGPERGPDPAYAFHTPYLEYRPGPLVFSIRFQGLQASFGELVIHVNSFVPGSGANALLVTLARVPVTELAMSEDEIIIKINALPDISFAVFGYFPEGTDASATDLSITVEEFGHVEQPGVPIDALSPTRFGTDELMRPDFLVASQPPTFMKPVSQLMTMAQLDEDGYRERVAQLPDAPAAPATQWQHAFIVQALECYGMLRPGARGLALGSAGSELAIIARAHGCGATIGVETAEAETITPRGGVIVVPLAIAEELPADLRGFDFCWSIAPAGVYRSVQEARTFVIGSLRSLRPGGCAVHLIDMIGVRGTAAVPRDGLTRGEIESLALLLISRGHDVAQLNFANHEYGTGTDDEAVPFGLIIRRGRV